jgi:hypothetical protein
LGHERRRGREGLYTISLSTGGCGALADFPLVLQVNVPAPLLAGVVLQGEGVDAGALLDGVLALGVVGSESGVDGIKGGRGREGVWINPTSCQIITAKKKHGRGWCGLSEMQQNMDFHSRGSGGMGLPSFTDMMA